MATIYGVGVIAHAGVIVSAGVAVAVVVVVGGGVGVADWLCCCSCWFCCCCNWVRSMLWSMLVHASLDKFSTTTPLTTPLL